MAQRPMGLNGVEISRHVEKVTDAATEQTQQHAAEENGDASQGAASGGMLQDTVIFYRLVKTSKEFRLYFNSSIVSAVGDWFNYIACIKFIESIYPENYTFVSVLVILRLIPKLLFETLGGVIADAHDRRLNMIYLDVISAVISLAYLLALQLRSVTLLYVLVFCHEVTGSLYDPSSEAIFPQIVRDEKVMEVSCVVFEVSYATSAAFASSLGGFFTVLFGTRTCFVLDGATYIFSAWLLYQMHGSWTADEDEESDEEESDEAESDEAESDDDELEGDCRDSRRDDDESKTWVRKYISMISSGMHYVWSTSVGALVLIKATGMIMYGATEVLAVTFSDQAGDPQGSSMRLGIIYSFYGVGCIVGPLLGNVFTDIKNPRTLQVASIVSFAIIALSWMGMAQFVPFLAKCLFMALSSCGAQILWLDSDLLILKFTKNSYLGRVSAVDNIFAYGCESLSALLAGILQDHLLLSASEVSWLFAGISFMFVFVWCIYHIGGGGVSSNLLDSAKKGASSIEQSEGVPTEKSSLLPPAPELRSL